MHNNEIQLNSINCLLQLYFRISLCMFKYVILQEYLTICFMFYVQILTSQHSWTFFSDCLKKKTLSDADFFFVLFYLLISYLDSLIRLISPLHFFCVLAVQLTLLNDCWKSLCCVGIQSRLFEYWMSSHKTNVCLCSVIILISGKAAGDSPTSWKKAI